MDGDHSDTSVNGPGAPNKSNNDDKDDLIKSLQYDKKNLEKIARAALDEGEKYKKMWQKTEDEFRMLKQSITGPPKKINTRADESKKKELDSHHQRITQHETNFNEATKMILEQKVIIGILRDCIDRLSGMKTTNVTFIPNNSNITNTIQPHPSKKDLIQNIKLPSVPKKAPSLIKQEELISLVVDSHNDNDDDE